MIVDYQDMLAELGVASAHPGGPGLTRSWARHLNWSGLDNVLEIGCGTGRSLIEVCSGYGCNGFGVDVRKVMIEKAKERAKQVKASGVQFAVAQANHLPFTEDSFDLAYSESVNVFLSHPEAALAEVQRVLRPGGTYVDVEMMVLQPVDQRWRDGVARVYGAKFVPDQAGWKRLFKRAGFETVKVLLTRSVDPSSLATADDGFEQSVDLTTPGAYERPEVRAALQANALWMEHNYRPLGYAVFVCQKSR